MIRAGMLLTKCLLAGAFLVLVPGCTRSPLLASGPIDIGPSPVLVRFERPASTEGTRWELCFEFDPPGYSLSAYRIRAVLLDSADRRYALVGTKLDRRGEAVVCLVGRIESIGLAPGVSRPKPPAFVAVELSSDIPMHMRAIRGGTNAP